MNGDLEEEIFMQQPEGYEDKERPIQVCKLKKLIFGLEQAARCWNCKLDLFVKSSNYVQMESDPCLYLLTIGSDFVILMVYVDDLIITSNSMDLLQAEKPTFGSNFDMTDQKDSSFILGISVIGIEPRGEWQYNRNCI